MIKRIYKSIFYRLKQTSLLLVVMFVISLLVCTAFSLKNVSRELKESLSKAIKPDVSITSYANYIDKKLYLLEDDKKEEYCEQFYDDLMHLKEALNPNYFDINMVISSYMLLPYDENDGLLISLQSDSKNEQLNTCLYDFNNYLNGNANSYSCNLSFVSVSTNDFMDLHYNFIDSDKSYIESGSMQNQMADFEEAGFKIKEGRNFTDEEIKEGKMVCLVTPNTYIYQNGEYRKVEVGDYVSYSIMIPGESENVIHKTYEFEVIGITNQEKMAYSKSIYNNLEGPLIPEKVFLEIYSDLKKITKEENLDKYNFIYFYPCIMTLNSFDDIDKFLEYVDDLNSDIEDKNYAYETSLDSYYSFAGNLETISENSSILFKFSLIVSILLNVFIINLDLNRRKKEIGLLSSLGQSRKTTMIQLVLEYLFILIISLLFAVLVSNIISNTFIKTLELNTDSILSNATKVLDYSKSISILNNTSLSINVLDLLKIAIMEIIIITITTILSVIPIFSIKTREVMIDE